MAQSQPRPILNQPPFSGLNPELIYKFFAVYSRFEYALKHTGSARFLKCNSEKDFQGRKYRERPDANWEKFARETERDYNEARANDPSFDVAVRHFIDCPPMKEVAVPDGHNGWKTDFLPVPEKDDTEWVNITKYIKRLRNNLFHGGKYSSPYFPERDETLLEYAETILRTCLSWQSQRDVGDAFFSPK